MIAILGASEDDVLYFKTKMIVKEKTKIFGDIEAYVGTFSSDECVVAFLGYSSYRSSLITAIIISKFEPYLIFNVGTAISFSPKLKQGDLFIADRYYLSDVDYTPSHQGTFGQIPDMPQYYIGDTNLNGKAETAAYALTSRFVLRGYLLSGEQFTFDENAYNSFVRSHFITEEGLCAYDTTSGGIALASYLSQVSLLTIKAISYQAGRDEQRISYIRKGLEVMPTIGKIITKLLIEKETV